MGAHLVTLHDRQSILRWASNITTDRRSPAAVQANAGPLLEFLEGNTGPADLEARHAALDRAAVNVMAAYHDWNPDGGAPDPRPMNDPGRLVADAKTYYTFIAAPHVA